MIDTLIRPARQRGDTEVRFTAGEVRRGVPVPASNLQNVHRVLRQLQFHRDAGVGLIDGPPTPLANSLFVFQINPEPTLEDQPAVRRRDFGKPFDIQADLDTFLRDRNPDSRYASFDYCYNFFRGAYESEQLSTLDSGAGLTLACLHLGFYLASWGMYRGGTLLLSTSARRLTPVVKEIVESPPGIWNIDVDGYDETSWPLLNDAYTRLKKTLPVEGSRDATDTLVTKVMLGVFGCVPALDRNFKAGLGHCKISPQRWDKRMLFRLREFYEVNRAALDRGRMPTFDFATGAETSHTYTRAKAIDMVFFSLGERVLRAKQRNDDAV